jgi:hypothetical protein
MRSMRFLRFTAAPTFTHESPAGNETPFSGVQRVAAVFPFGYTPQMPLGS